MPPIADTKDSRLRFFDLDPLLADIRGPEGTAWIPESARVLRSGAYQFLDEPYIEQIIVAKLSCPEMYDNGLNSYGSNVSRASVNFEVNPKKPNCAQYASSLLEPLTHTHTHTHATPRCSATFHFWLVFLPGSPIPEDGLNLVNMDGDCGVIVLPGELVDGIPFEPRCLVLVLAAESERIMFDEMMAAGRKMSDPFFVEVNYSVALGSAPDVKTVGTNCGNSRVLLENYERDRVGQDVRDELQETRTAIATQQELIAFWDHVQNNRAMVSIDPTTGLIRSVLPPSPSPPPPPPPVLHNAPPAPPEQVSNAVQTQRLADELVALETRRDALVASLDDCYVPDRPSGVVCGLSSQEAPDPWMALNGVKCRGYDTRSARERDFCGCVLLKPLCQSCHLLVTHASTLCRLGQRSEPHGRRQQAAQAAARGWSLLRRRRRKHGLLLVQCHTHAAIGHVRPKVHGARRPAFLVRQF